MSILVVEDDPFVRDMLMQALEDEGYRVLGAATGGEALEMLEPGRPLPEVILLDLMMPQMNGWEFRERQKVDPRLAGIPLVLLSARHDGAGQARAVGADAYVAKPVDLDVLAETVRRFCLPG